jgi:hypothetical protein
MIAPDFRQFEMHARVGRSEAAFVRALAVHHDFEHAMGMTVQLKRLIACVIGVVTV